MLRLHILGSGTPTPTADRFGSSYVAQVDDELLMFDCGPAATHKLVKAGLWPTDVTNLFFTHHHFDHNIDYHCLLLCRWDQSIGGEQQLQVRGPAPTVATTNGLIGDDGVFAPDWKARVNHPLSQQVYVNRGGTLPRTPPDVRSADLTAGEVVRANTWEVTTASARHVQPYLDSLAYRLDTDDGSVVFTGDTEPCKSVVELARGADMMLCMCWDSQQRMRESGETVGQCGTTGAARMAEEAGVSTLVLVHTGPALASHGAMEQGIGDVYRDFGGSVVFAEELMRLEVS